MLTRDKKWQCLRLLNLGHIGLQYSHHYWSVLRCAHLYMKYLCTKVHFCSAANAPGVSLMSGDIWTVSEVAEWWYHLTDILISIIYDAILCRRRQPDVRGGALRWRIGQWFGHRTIRRDKNEFIQSVVYYARRQQNKNTYKVYSKS